MGRRSQLHTLIRRVNAEDRLDGTTNIFDDLGQSPFIIIIILSSKDAPFATQEDVEGPESFSLPLR